MKIYKYSEVTSTQKVAKEILKKRKKNFAVVANYQTEGRGRLEREWVSPPGGLYMSVVIKKDERAFMRAGVAVASALRKIGINAVLKWPNDVIVNNKKIAGILVENEGNKSIIGIGVNIDIAPIKDATCIECEEVKIRKDKLIRMILRGLKNRRVYEDYKKLCSTLGKKVRILLLNDEIEGKAIDIDEYGRIVIDTGEKLKKIFTGDCIHLR